LTKKADRFLDKQSIQKEKEQYRKQVRDQIIMNQTNKRAFVSS
jgi:hypothetical protein